MDNMNKIVKDISGVTINLESEYSTRDIFKTILRQKDAANNLALYDLSKLKSLIHNWNQKLPNVRPFYAVKSNPDLQIISKLAHLGAGFDFASAKELESARTININFETDAICAQPFKSEEFCSSISNSGVVYATFESVEELQIAANFGMRNLKFILLIEGGDEKDIPAGYRKFGAVKSEYRNIFLDAGILGLKISGISFYVGHSMKNTDAFYKAIENASEAWKIAEEFGFIMEILDIGGGFSESNFSSAAVDVTRGLDEFFSEKNIRIVAEPGKYFSESVLSTCNTIINKTIKIVEGNTIIEYTLSDGIEGAFYFLSFSKDNVVTPIFMGENDNSQSYSIFYGPKGEKIAECEFPLVEIGDKVSFEKMGAYSNIFTESVSNEDLNYSKLYLDEQ
ncbi:unnamed protein product [Blepharisma stoltei]|uniref:ornithine decarboxylase n=1 Tax=Blepharisma stoltei TaxID=1481888 RepID=A0AAU9JYW5_9CILI|nr:unnamed protein product [Blepharisma stoltei]